MNDNLRSKIHDILREDQIICREPMRNHTTFRVGGEADLFLVPENEKEAAALLRLISDSREPHFVLGNGSNLLVSDSGYRGTIIWFDKQFSDISVNDDTIFASAGALLVKIAQMAFENGLTGMEFASGIPGTLGGGITMNAGAYGGELKDIVKSVRLFDYSTKEVVEKSSEEMDFSYRHSIVRQGGYAVLGATLKLEKGDKTLIGDRMEELRQLRTQKQPLEYASAGSTFKRPEGAFAGKLIEEAGLKGFRIGGAMVSEKHAGFVINTGDATAEDIITLIREIRKRVHAASGFWLEPEICMLGEGLAL